MASVFCYPNLTTPVNTRYDNIEDFLDKASKSLNGERSLVYSMDKERRRGFLKASTTNWPCISLVEGVNPALRVSRDNPPVRLHGFLADYDSLGKALTISEVADAATRCAFSPNYGGPSLSKMGFHVIWMFKEPMPLLGDYEYAKKVISTCYRNLRAGNFLQGFDDASKRPELLVSIDPCEFGTFSDSYIMEEATRAWAAEALKDYNFKGEGPALDLEKIKPLVDEMYPGRWTGPFVHGARGVRFWDLSSSDPSAAMVVPEGMIYFTEGGGFKPWSALIGADFVSKLQSDELAHVTRNYWYIDSKKEYATYEPQDDLYRVRNVAQMNNRLELLGGLEGKKVKDAVLYIETHKTVEAIVKLANHTRGIMEYHGRKYINCTQTKHVIPKKGDFKFIDALLCGMFPDSLQREHLIAWIADSHKNLFTCTPSYAQALFLAGEAQCGKTLLQCRILTPLFGGSSADPMPYFTGLSGFNSELADAGHWLVSDQEADGRQRAKFDQQVKAITANPIMQVHAKYGTPETFDMNCRVTFSFNKNVESLSVIPRLGSDVIDKLILLDVSSHNVFAGLHNTDIEPLIKQELPAFSWYLLNEYNPPKEVRQSGRYRIKSYHHPTLLQHVRATQVTSEIMGLIHIVFTECEVIKSMVDRGEKPRYSAIKWKQLFDQYAGKDSIKTNYVNTQLLALGRQYPEAIKANYDLRYKTYVFTIDYNKLTETEAT